MITVIDYNMGNHGSILNMLRKLGIEAEITADPERIARATQLILPGVGAFDAGMEHLERSGVVGALHERVLQARVPVLGICLGMQLMTRGSAEGQRPGLGWMDADVVRFEPFAAAPKVPHMGWNRVSVAQASPLVDDLPDEPRFYFVHSYFVRCDDRSDVILTTQYGIEFHSGFQSHNIYGVQFHPEKSHKFGMQLLRNFAERCRVC